MVASSPYGMKWNKGNPALRKASCGLLAAIEFNAIQSIRNVHETTYASLFYVGVDLSALCE
jgi:hypothetical protein